LPYLSKHGTRQSCDENIYIEFTSRIFRQVPGKCRASKRQASAGQAPDKRRASAGQAPGKRRANARQASGKRQTSTLQAPDKHLASAGQSPCNRRASDGQATGKRRASTGQVPGKIYIYNLDLLRQTGDIGLVWSLNEIKDVEDKKLLSGHVAMILGDFDLAQNLYLQSGSPVEALNMRRDLLQVG
jgi:hypothetical protein